MFKRFVATTALAAGIVALAFSFGVCMAIIFTNMARSQPAAPNEQALGAKLMGEIQAGLMCESAKITMQRRLEELEKRLKELEPKPAPETK